MIDLHNKKKLKPGNDYYEKVINAQSISLNIKKTIFFYSYIRFQHSQIVQWCNYFFNDFQWLIWFHENIYLKLLLETSTCFFIMFKTSVGQYLTIFFWRGFKQWKFKKIFSYSTSSLFTMWHWTTQSNNTIPIVDFQNML